MHAIASLVVLTSLAAGIASATDAVGIEALEATVRRLDLAEADAVLRGDFDAVEKLWAKDMTVNNPFNQVVKSSSGRVRTGAVTYSSFVRNIESIQIHGGTQ